MRLYTLFEMDGQYIPYDRAKGIVQLVAKEIVRVAKRKGGGNKEIVAALKEYSDRFKKDLDDAITDELRYGNLQNVDTE